METPVTHDQIIQMFDTQQNAILEINRINATAINARTISEIDRVAEKMDIMIERQDVANNNIAKNNKTTERVDRINKNVKWYVLGLFGFMYSTCWIYDSFNLKEIIMKLIYKI